MLQSVDHVPVRLKIRAGDFAVSRWRLVWILAALTDAYKRERHPDRC
jgi:hypothetical protein